MAQRHRFPSASLPLKILHVVGARPNFPKLAPVHRAGVARQVTQVIVHTGQHYDEALSTSFFNTLGIPEPDVNLSVGSGSHAQQTARMIERLEPVLLEHDPDWVVVYGDVNSTLAAAVVASKIGLRLAHVEAGLRSGDRTMPEEINRLVTDRLATLLLTPSRDADERLRSEGEPDDEIVFVGNVMVDTLLRTMGKLGTERPQALPADAPIVVTLHRPSNVDDVDRLTRIMASLRAVAARRGVQFAAHPRTTSRLAALGVSTDGLEMLGPIPYEDMLARVMRAAAVVTDSGGLQEETTVLGVPCLTLRDNTERPVTITEGTNQLVRDLEAIPRLVEEVAVAGASSKRPEGWDGRAGERVIEALVSRPR